MCFPKGSTDVRKCHRFFLVFPRNPMAQIRKVSAPALETGSIPGTPTVASAPWMWKSRGFWGVYPGMKLGNPRKMIYLRWFTLGYIGFTRHWDFTNDSWVNLKWGTVCGEIPGITAVTNNEFICFVSNHAWNLNDRIQDELRRSTPVSNRVWWKQSAWGLHRLNTCCETSLGTRLLKGQVLPMMMFH